MSPVDVIVKEMFSTMTSEQNKNRAEIKENDEVAILVNNLGAISKMEEYIFCREVLVYFGEFISPFRKVSIHVCGYKEIVNNTNYVHLILVQAIK